MKLSGAWWLPASGLLSIVFIVFAVLTAKLVIYDLRLFALEKSIAQWSVQHLPSPEALANAKSELAWFDRNQNPRVVFLQVWLMDWQAYSDPGQARFYWIQADQMLNNMTNKYPTEAKAWAYRASMNAKLGRIELAKTFAARANQLGSGEIETQDLLKTIDFTDYYGEG